MVKEIVVFTDGSCANNGKGYAIGGIGIHFPDGELEDISKIYKGHCTNQNTELYAILTALRYLKKNFNLEKYIIYIKTDSLYSINCITKWSQKWEKNNWKTINNSPVVHRELIQKIRKYYDKYKIIFSHVYGHTEGDDEESIANGIADKLATDATKTALILRKKGAEIEKNKDFQKAKNETKKERLLREKRAAKEKNRDFQKSSRKIRKTDSRDNRIYHDFSVELVDT
jgi:ribonuclease HI